MKSLSKQSLILGLLLVIFPGIAQASLVLAMKLSEMHDKADEVVLVRVLSEKIVDDASIIQRRYRLRVIKTVKGKSKVGALRYMRSLGGERDGIVTIVGGEPRLRIGEEYLIFGRRWSVAKGDMRPVGLSQGVMHKQETEAGKDQLCPLGASTRFVRPLADGKLSAASGALSRCRPMAEVFRELRAL